MPRQNAPFPYDSILYDLDGTLIDHFGTIYHSYRYALQKLNLPPVTFEEVKAAVGGSVIVTMSKLIGEDQAPHAVVYFREYFDRHIFEHLHALPGAAWLLQSLASYNVPQAVFTNKNGPAARRVCEHLRFTQHLEHVVGTEDTPHRKPQLEFSQHILKTMSCEPSTTLLIGDSPYDLEAAQVVNMPAAAVTTGSHSREQLLATGLPCVGIYDNLYQLGEDLFQLPVPAQPELGAPCSLQQ